MFVFFIKIKKMAIQSENTQLWQGGRRIHEANDSDSGVGAREQHRGVGVERILASGTVRAFERAPQRVHRYDRLTSDCRNATAMFVDTHLGRGHGCMSLPSARLVLVPPCREEQRASLRSVSLGNGRHYVPAAAKLSPYLCRV